MPRGLQSRGHLEEERGLSDARLTTNQDHGARYNAAAENEVELVEPRLPSLGLGTAHVTKSRRGGDASALCERSRASRPACRAATCGNLGRNHLLGERVPLAAGVTPSLPLGVLGAALGAAIDGLGFGHQRG